MAWHQPRGYRKCPVAYNAAAHADPLSERIVGQPSLTGLGESCRHPPTVGRRLQMKPSDAYDSMGIACVYPLASNKQEDSSLAVGPANLIPAIVVGQVIPCRRRGKPVHH